MLKVLSSLVAASAVLFSLSAQATLDFTPTQQVKPVEDTVKGNSYSLSSRNTVVLRGEISDESTGKALMNILRIKEDTVYLFLSSPGGSVVSGLKFISGLQGSGKKIVCLTDFSASMSFVILQACHERVAFNSSVIMQHVASVGAKGEWPNFQSYVKLLTEMLDQSDRAQAKRLGISVEEFRRKIADDMWLFGNQALKEKAVDKIATASCSQEMIDGTTNETLYTFFGEIHLTWSNCPLITYPVDVQFGRNFVQSKESQQEVNRLLNFRQEAVTNPDQYKYGPTGRITQ